MVPTLAVPLGHLPLTGGVGLIGPPEQKERADEAEARRALEAVMAAADERLKPKEVARRAQEMAPGWSAKELYELLTRA